MKLQAFAKINWSLDITGVREDGYHFMDMLMQPVSISDEIEISSAPALSVTVSGFPPVRADESNLAYRAAAALKKAGHYRSGAAIHLFKRIPVGAGMGGGSTDAAAVLVGLNKLWGLSLPSAELEKIGLTIGADVPFFIRGGLTRTRGIGEAMESYEAEYNYWLLVIQPCAGLSTSQVFGLWHDDPEMKRPDTDAALQALRSGNLSLLCASVENVLQPVSAHLRPEIGTACGRLVDEGAMAAKMTGSGSAVFGVFRSRPMAERAFRNLSAVYRTVFLCHTQHDSIRLEED